MYLSTLYQELGELRAWKFSTW